MSKRPLTLSWLCAWLHCVLGWLLAGSGLAPVLFGPVLLAPALFAPALVGQDRAPTGSTTPPVLVVPLAGKLGTPELARCHRALRQAEAEGIAWVVFRCDLDTGSHTEDPADLQSLFDHIQAGKVATITLVRGRATQGAAWLALCTDRLYCQTGAQLGELVKPEQDWEELFAADPDQVMARRLAGVREVLEQRLQRRKHPLRADAQKVALAMADPRQQLVTATVREAGIERPRILEAAEINALQGSGATVLGQEKLPRPLIADARLLEDLGLSSGTVQDLDQLCGDVLGLGRDSYRVIGDDWAEHMVGWLEMIQPFLLVAGFLLILLEIKTPGFGLPGLLGTAFLGLAMFHSYLVGLADTAEVVVFFLGLAAIAVELFVLPGTVVFGLVGFVCLVLALVLSQQSFAWPSNAEEEGILVANLLRLLLQFAIVVALGSVLWRLLPKLPWVGGAVLAAPTPGAGGAEAPAGSGLGVTPVPTALVGRVGRAATVLRPTGAMELDGERIDVVTEGEFLEAGVPLRVLYVQGPRIVVGAVTEADAAPGQRGSAGVVLLLAVVGLALLVAEVFFVSFGVIAALSGLALLGAVFLAFQDSTTFGVVVLIAEAVAAPLVLGMSLKLLPRTRLGKELILAGPTTSGSAAAADESLGTLVGQTGVTVSALRPAGFARIAGRRVDVVTRGEMLPADVPVKVLEVSGNRVVVARC